MRFERFVGIDVKRRFGWTQYCCGMCSARELKKPLRNVVTFRTRSSLCNCICVVSDGLDVGRCIVALIVEF